MVGSCRDQTHSVTRHRGLHSRRDGRSWRRGQALAGNTEVAGPLAEKIATSACLVAELGNQPIDIQEGWNLPYDFVIAIGIDLPYGAGVGLRIGGTGWAALIGADALISEDPNPVEPTAASAIAAAEAFKIIFSDTLGDLFRPLPGTFCWSVWDYPIRHLHT